MERRENILRIEDFIRKNVSPSERLEFVFGNIYILLFEDQNNDNYVNVAKMMLEPFNKEMLSEFRELIDGLAVSDIKDLIELALSYRCHRFDDSSSKELCNLSLKMFGDSLDGSILCDTCVGRGDFLLEAINYSKNNNFIYKDLFGTDINYQNVNITNIILKVITRLNGLDYLPSIKALNSMTDNFGFPITHAYVFPPIGLMFSIKENNIPSKLYENIRFTGRNSAEWIFIDNVLAQHRYCKMIAIVSARALYNKEDVAYRNLLIENRRLEGIIELPQGACEGTSSKLVMLILSCNNDNIRILNASDFNLTNAISHKKVFDADRIYNEYISEKCTIKTIEDLINSNNILPSNLELGEIEVKNGVVLSELAEVFTGSQYTLKNFEDKFAYEPTGYRVLTSSDIENGMVDWKKLQSIYYNDVKFDKYAVHKGDVVVTSKSSKVKTVVVDIEPKEKILVTGGMIIVRPNQEKLNPTYLKMFLDSEKGIKTLKSIQKGTIIITINSKDISGILIPMVDIKKQKSMAKLYNDKLTTIMGYKLEIEKMEKSLANIFEDQVEE